MENIEHVVIRVKALLQSMNIKLWQEPYFDKEGGGSNSSEIDKLAGQFSQNLSITESKCRVALLDLQSGALRKLAARREFNDTGMATFYVRCVSNKSADRRVLEVKCPLYELGRYLYEQVAVALQVDFQRVVKCITAGRLVDLDHTLLEQDMRNNQQLMVILAESRNADNGNENGGSSSNTSLGGNVAMYDRINKIRRDVETIVDSENVLLEMEDQDGNAVFMPPSENHAMLMAMGFYEKARAALKRRDYAESLILLLEADEHFAQCTSRFLDTIDNYALVNLDIVWCYMCLKNMAQLPDAQRRLEICEKNFHRSYGQNLERLIAIKGSGCQERALIMRMHLLQGVVLFHQNQRNEAYEKFLQAERELSGLQVDEEAVTTLVSMGYKPHEARMGLRASGGNIEEAVTHIVQQKERLSESRRQSNRERKMERHNTRHANDENWVNPRSVYALVDMGFQHRLAVEALRRSKNNLVMAVDLLHNNLDELTAALPTAETPVPVDEDLLQALRNFGFREDQVHLALGINRNDLAKTIEFLCELCQTEEEVNTLLQQLATTTQLDNNTPSTSSGVSHLMRQVMDKAKSKLDTLQSFNRFKEDISGNEHDYLDMDLQQELELLILYKSMLE